VLKHLNQGDARNSQLTARIGNLRLGRLGSLGGNDCPVPFGRKGNDKRIRLSVGVGWIDQRRKLIYDASGPFLDLRVSSKADEHLFSSRLAPFEKVVLFLFEFMQ
jgi:hypothetical protein